MVSNTFLTVWKGFLFSEIFFKDNRILTAQAIYVPMLRHPAILLTKLRAHLFVANGNKSYHKRLKIKFV